MIRDGGRNGIPPYACSWRCPPLRRLLAALLRWLGACSAKFQSPHQPEVGRYRASHSVIDDLTVQGVNINRHEKSAPGMTKGGDASTGQGEWGVSEGGRLSYRPRGRPVPTR